MRTKLVLGAAILAAGLASSMAQNVYSLNVVGYVNQTVQTGQWYLWGNPLDAGTNTTAVVLSGLSGDLNDWSGAQVYGYDSSTGFSSTGDQYVPGYGWFPGTIDLTPGKGFFFLAPTNGTVTFVGNVVMTNSFNLAGNGKWSLVASAFPVSTNLVQLGLIGGPSDEVYRYAAPGGYNSGSQYVPGYGWFDSAGSTTNGPVLNVGEAVFYQNANATVDWVKSFTIQ